MGDQESYRAGAARDDQETGGKGNQSYDKEASEDMSGKALAYEVEASRDVMGGKGNHSYDKEAAPEALRDDTGGKGNQSYEEEAAED